MAVGKTAAYGLSGRVATSRRNLALPSNGLCLMDTHSPHTNTTMRIIGTASNMDFNGHGPAHRRRLRPDRGILEGNLSEDSDNEYGNATDALPNRVRNEIILPIPFASTSCTTCLQQRKGDFIFLNLNAALQHTRSHRCGVGVLYSCNTCGKTYKGKHAAQCHVPKCKGPSMGEGTPAICGI